MSVSLHMQSSGVWPRLIVYAGYPIFGHVRIPPPSPRVSSYIIIMSLGVTSWGTCDHSTPPFNLTLPPSPLLPRAVISMRLSQPALGASCIYMHKRCMHRSAFASLVSVLFSPSMAGFPDNIPCVDFIHPPSSLSLSLCLSKVRLGYKHNSHVNGTQAKNKE